MMQASESNDLGAALLVVDDEAEVAAVLSEGLQLFGYQVTTAGSGEEALRRLEERRFDALLTDVQMPRMRGDELQRQAREYDPDMAVLMVTAATDINCAVQCMKEGVFDYMTKPFDLQDVAVRVQKALDRRQLILQQKWLQRQNYDYQLNLERRVAEQAERLRLLFQNSLQALNEALEAKDRYTRNHSVRVAELSNALAMRLRPDDTSFHSRLHLAALLHDIGKIGVSEAILLKPGKLEPEEFAEIKKHPVIGENILRPMFEDAQMLQVVRHHHEQWNGSGYPDGLAGEAIPFAARIVAVADAYDAMTSARPYRDGMAQERALQILEEGANVQWDAEVVAACLDLARSGELNRIVERADRSGSCKSALGVTHLFSDLGAMRAAA